MDRYTSISEENRDRETLAAAVAVLALMSAEQRKRVFNVCNGISWGALESEIEAAGETEKVSSLPGFSGILPSPKDLFLNLISALESGADVVPYVAGVAVLLGILPPDVAIKMTSIAEIISYAARKIDGPGLSTRPALPGPTNPPSFP